jgi:hypothetical protein
MGGMMNLKGLLMAPLKFSNLPLAHFLLVDCTSKSSSAFSLLVGFSVYFPHFKVLINGLQSLGGIYLAVAISKEYKQCLDGYMGFFNMVLMIH